ncbi:hypothetical protein B0J13DRAFT_520061 [Dactylonectria estremocensis]|uniref:Uncharacterized protein n=1 Tax=Dactylonectria estremocensis TaxID=1079267 RepID=A0A9P9FB54_9HYPO|nr:hypothetical protein B0J13DRAFT_520061 [Dactylonectria estremocensis]
MTTRESSGQRSARHQGRQIHARTSDPQQMSEVPTTIEEECNRLAQEIANIPALARDCLSREVANSHVMRDSNNLNRDLTSQLHRLTRELQHRESAIHHLEAKLEASKAEIQNLRIKEQALRDFILESDPYQGVSDGDVISAFTTIRQWIQKLASNKMLQLDGPPIDLKSSAFTAEEDLFSLWPGCSRSGRVMILRALLFRILADQILMQDFFGIPGLEDNLAQNDDSISDLSTGLSRFERALIHRSVPTDLVVNWRLSTLRGVEAAGMSEGAVGTALAEQLYNLFATIIAEEATQQDRVKLQDGFRGLCSQAYSLRLLMRKSKENYQCLPISTGALLDEVEHLADVYGETDDKPGGRVRVALTLCDGLVKSQPQTDQPLVLEKAQVVITKQ